MCAIITPTLEFGTLFESPPPFYRTNGELSFIVVRNSTSPLPPSEQREGVQGEDTDLIIVQVVGQASDEELVCRVRYHRRHHAYRAHTHTRLGLVKGQCFGWMCAFHD